MAAQMGGLLKRKHKSFNPAAVTSVFVTFLVHSLNAGCMVYEKLGEQVFGTPGKMLVFGSTSLQNIGGKGDEGH